MKNTDDNKVFPICSICNMYHICSFSHTILWKPLSWDFASMDNKDVGMIQELFKTSEFFTRKLITKHVLCTYQGLGKPQLWANTKLRIWVSITVPLISQVQKYTSFPKKTATYGLHLICASEHPRSTYQHQQSLDFIKRCTFRSNRY